MKAILRFHEASIQLWSFIRLNHQDLVKLMNAWTVIKLGSVCRVYTASIKSISWWNQWLNNHLLSYWVQQRLLVLRINIWMKITILSYFPPSFPPQRNFTKISPSAHHIVSKVGFDQSWEKCFVFWEEKYQQAKFPTTSYVCLKYSLKKLHSKLLYISTKFPRNKLPMAYSTIFPLWTTIFKYNVVQLVK